MFNILGPLSHPGRLKCHLIGTSNLKIAGQMAEVLMANGSERAWVVTGEDGVDEISVTGPSNIVELKNGEISEWVLDPVDLGISYSSPDDLKGGSAEKNAQIARDIFSGAETGAKREMVLLNAAAALVVSGVARDINEGLKKVASLVWLNFLAVFPKSWHHINWKNWMEPAEPLRLLMLQPTGNQ